jgi:hypothetical protein
MPMTSSRKFKIYYILSRAWWSTNRCRVANGGLCSGCADMQENECCSDKLQGRDLAAKTAKSLSSVTSSRIERVISLIP